MADVNETDKQKIPPMGAPFNTKMIMNDCGKYSWLTRACDTQEESDAKYQYILGLLQLVRAEAKNLWELLGEMKKEILDRPTPENVQVIVIPYEKIYKANVDEIGNFVKDLRAILDCDPAYIQHMGDEIRSIENYWERFSTFFPNLENPRSDAILYGIDKCQRSLEEIIFQCGYRTIPDRLMGHLSHAKIPQAISFYGTFEDELCSKEQAEKILGFLSKNSNILQKKICRRRMGKKCEEERVTEEVIGAVDTIQGLVYRVGTKQEQVMTVVWLALASFLTLIVCAGVLFFYNVWVNPAWPLTLIDVFVLFIVILGGAIAHIAIAVLKEVRSEQKTRQIHAINDLLLWTHIKSFTFISGLAILAVSFITLVIVYPDIGVATIFVAGYSIDSLGDLYIDRFESVMTAKSDVLKKAL